MSPRTGSRWPTRPRFWFVLQWAYSAGYAASGAGSVAYLAHVFGFLAGVLIGLVVRAASPPPQYPVHPRLRQV
jgi:membrane associated rhomboid family serine protease